MATYEIPSDWDIRDSSTWCLHTTVDADMGIHGPTGGTIRQYQNIRHCACDYEAGEDMDRWVAEDTTPCQTAQWWADVLVPIHTAECRIAEASTETIERAMIALGADPSERRFGAVITIWDAEQIDDLEQHAAVARRIIATLRGDPDPDAPRTVAVWECGRRHEPTPAGYSHLICSFWQGILAVNATDGSVTYVRRNEAPRVAYTAASVGPLCARRDTARHPAASAIVTAALAAGFTVELVTDAEENA